MVEMLSNIDVGPYLGFHRLKKDSIRALKETEDCLRRPFELYPKALHLLAQNMDKGGQQEAEKKLHDWISSCPPILKENKSDENRSREQRNTYKVRYFEEIACSSAIQALNQLLESEKAQKQRDLGFSGGLIKIDITNIESSEFPYRNIRPEIIALSEIDINLLNKELADETLSPFAPSFSPRRNAFIKSGFSIHSLEYKLFLLAKMELTVKRHMLCPILDEIKFFGVDPIVIYDRNNRERQFEQKKLRLINLLFGKRGGSSFETRAGTEFFRGFLELIRKRTSELLFHFPEKDREDILLLINTLTFMRTSNLQSRQSVEQLYEQILKHLALKQYDEAKGEIKQILFKNPKLWPWFAQYQFPLTDEEYLELKILLEPRKQAQPDKEGKPISPKSSERDPSLKPAVEQLIGKHFTVFEMFGNTKYEVIKFTQKSPGKGLPPEPGYVIVSEEITEGFNENKKTHFRLNILAYGSILKLVEMSKDQRFRA